MVQFNDNEPIDRVRNVVDIWEHNRKLYPGWLVFPSGQERSELSWRTDEWELPILNVLPGLTPIERLRAIRELIWRKEILLEPITLDLVAAAEQALGDIDCEMHTIEGVNATRDDWGELRESWVVVAFALVTDARLDCDLSLFEQRLDALRPFSNDNPDVEHRIQQESCLWAAYSLDFDKLNSLLDMWVVENCDPAWMLRKAALLTEARRHDESIVMVQDALNSLREDLADGKSIASASRESWALASTLTMNNRQSIYREWDKLTSLKCDARAEIDQVRRALRRTDDQDEAPSFDLGVRQGARVRFSNIRRTRLIAAYRAIRLLEVAGVPPVNSPGRDTAIPMSMASDLLTLAADELVATNPKLSIRLVLRICRYDGDKTLQRVLSRSRLARLTDDATEELAQLCVGVIQHALPLLFATEERFGGISWVERMRVALEVLSRLVLRLPSSMATQALDVGLECYRTDRVAQHVWLGPPLGNLLERAWEVLSKNHRANRALDLLIAPMAGLDNFAPDANCPDPGHFIGANDLPTERTSDNEEQFRAVVDLLIRGLRGNDDTRGRATFRLIPLVIANSLTEEESSGIAFALWQDSDPILHNLSSRNAPLDWVYLMLPEVNEGQAEQSFRTKWLTQVVAIQGQQEEDSSRLLTQVGSAVSGLRKRGRPFLLSNEDEQLVAAHIEALVEMFSSSSISFTLGIHSAMSHVATLSAEITMPEQIAENLFRRVELIIGAPGHPKDSWIGQVSDIRIALAFAVIPGLVKAMPERFETMSLWLRTGLASEDDARPRGAMDALRSWLSASATSMSTPVPDELIREVGAIIASDRRVALADALVVATLVFNVGSERNRDTISPLALQGLSYLAERLDYDNDQNLYGDVHTLRLLCAQLATRIAAYGLEDDATVTKWLNIGRSDPFPETRDVVDSYESR